MSFELKEERPVKGLSITTTADSKFNTETIIVRFILPIEQETTQKRWTVISMLTDACAAYPDKTLLSRRLAELYGASLFSFSYKLGNYQVSGITMSSIGDRYTLNGEGITAECAELMLDCIFKPHMKDGVFDELLFENSRQELVNKIRSAADNRHTYALRRAGEIAFRGESSAVQLLGEEDTALAMTAEDVSEVYRDMLAKGFITVSFCGGGTNTEAQRIVSERLTEFAGSRDYDGEDIRGLTSLSPLKPEPEYVTEQIDQKQSKLVLVCKSASEDEFAVKLAVLIYGGTPFSKLFMNVREKMSLCYYCQSSMIEGKGTMVIDSGVAPGDEEKARAEILRQLTLMQQGEIDEEELEDTKRYYIGTLRSINDFSDDQNSWFFTRFGRGDLLTPQKAEEKVRAVTMERVIEAIRSFALDTVYTLEPTDKDAEGGDEDE